MMDDMVLLAVTVVGLLTGLLFMVKYHTKNRGAWRKYPMGRHLMGFIAAVVLCLLLLPVSMLWGPLPTWLWILSIIGVDIALIYRVYMLFSERWLSQGPAPSEDTVQHQTRRDR